MLKEWVIRITEERQHEGMEVKPDAVADITEGTIQRRSK